VFVPQEAFRVFKKRELCGLSWLAVSAVIAFLIFSVALTVTAIHNFVSMRRKKPVLVQPEINPVPPAIRPLSELEIQSMISIFPHQTTATTLLNQASNLRISGCMVIHNCSQEQMTALSLQNLRITLGQNTVLLSDHTINIRVEVGPRVFYEHLFSIDLHERQAEKILEKFHGVDYREFVEIGVSGKLVFSYAGKEHPKPVSMVFNTEARR
jgi:hypothetical protein